jgi:hypothetical protein
VAPPKGVVDGFPKGFEYVGGFPWPKEVLGFEPNKPPGLDVFVFDPNIVVPLLEKAFVLGLLNEELPNKLPPEGAVDVAPPNSEVLDPAGLLPNKLLVLVLAPKVVDVCGVVLNGLEVVVLLPPNIPPELVPPNPVFWFWPKFPNPDVAPKAPAWLLALPNLRPAL